MAYGEREREEGFNWLMGYVFVLSPTSSEYIVLGVKYCTVNRNALLYSNK